MTILDEIIERKRQEVEEVKSQISTAELRGTNGFRREPVSLRESLRGRSGIIAEVKRRSPSMGIINETVHVGSLAAGYAAAGVSAISVLTDGASFGGSKEDLLTARNVVSCPILRKEFIVDGYQVIESKAIGADAVLLLASVLKPVEMKSLVQLAHDIGLEVLAEAHNQGELECCLGANPDIVGINNRDLRDFSISLDVSRRLASMVPMNKCKVSESGINSVHDVNELRKIGYSGFLIGQAFMQHESPAEAAKEFILELQGKGRRQFA